MARDRPAGRSSEAKIWQMKMPPQRIAWVAIVVLLLVGGAAWWWEARTAVPRARVVQETPTTVAASRISRTVAPARVASDQEKPDPVAMAAAERCAEEMAAGMRERTRQLATRNDATSQLAYALTVQMVSEASPESEEEIERFLAEQRTVQQRAFARARELDPTHPDIAWLAAEKCFEGPECVAAQQASLQAEPDNTAVWLRAMTWARMRKDDAALEDAFKRAVAAPRYDSHRGSTLLAVMDGYAGLPTPAVCVDTGVQALILKELPGGRAFDAAVFVEMMALAGEIATAIYGMELRTLCKVEDGGALPKGRQADCVRIYSAMASGPSTVEQWMALSQLVELTADTPEGAAHRERYRNLEWLMQEQRKDWKQFDYLAMGTNEVETLQVALAKAGRWPPPANWLPEGERARSLILTGRPPEKKKPD